MKRSITTLLLRCYPAGWRERYGEEFAALIADERTSVLSILDILCSALRERLVAGAQLGDPTMRRPTVRRIMLFAVPALLLVANAQFAYVSYVHANAAHAEAESAAKTHNLDGMRFWKAMEAEEGGEYTDSIHFGLGFFFGLVLVGGLTAWNVKRRDASPT